jgi:sugar phosphate isomerase/epimerase
MHTLPPLGIQSFCFRTYKALPDLIDAMQQAGLSQIELWPGHLAHDSENAAAGLQQLKDGGLTVSSYGVVRVTDDEAANRQVLEFARSAGVKAITADMEPSVYRLAEKLCDEYDIYFAIHNHGKQHRYGTMEQIGAMLDQTSERIGLCLDTAWLLDAGGDPLAALDTFGRRVYGVHLKDFTFDAEGNHEDVIIGTGELDLPGFLAKLRAMGFDGYMSLEYEGDAEAPIPSVKECVQALNAAI